MKRIILMLTVAAMMAVALVVAAPTAAFADPDCSHVTNNQNCQTTTTLPSDNEPNPGSNACKNNQNCETVTTFKGRPQ